MEYKMENENTDYYQNSGYEFLSRNGEMKKCKSKPIIEDTKSELETVNDSILTDDTGSAVDHSEEDSNQEAIAFHVNVDKSHNRNENRVTLDAMMTSAPTVSVERYEVEDVKNATLKTLESSIHKLNIEDEPKFQEDYVPKEEYSLINTRALTKVATTYELEKFDKHALLIFNQEKIDGQQPRLGTEKDVESLTNTFTNFGFEVTSHKDLTKGDLFKELKTFSERDFTNYGCVAVAVLTHGSNNGLLRAKDQQYSEIEIINSFKGRNLLVTKHKLIIIQACRGTKIMQGVPVFQSGKIRKDLNEDLEPYILPVESDLLILHSSYVGSPSHRNELYGSWFIQALCRKINALSSTHDLESIITEVKREVAIDKQHEEYNKRTFEIDVNKQMPVMTSTLIRKLYLKKFGDRVKEVTYVDQLRQPNESSHEVLDAGSTSTPMTPLLVQFGPCSCFLDHFTYMRNCLRFYVEENPSDETAQNILDVANTFEDGDQFNLSKDKMCKAISKHLLNHARCSQFYKYLYFYKT